MAFSFSKIGQLVGSGEYLNGAVDLVGYGNYVYVISKDSNAVVAIDISTKTSPIRVGQITGAGNYLDFCRGVASFCDGTYLYVVSKDSNSFVIIDISTPSNPVRLGQLYGAGEYLNQPNSVTVEGDYAYVTGNISQSLVIIDISTKTSPIRVGQITGAGNYLDSPRGVIVNGDYVYVACDTQNSLAVFDVSTKSSPFKVGQIFTGSGGYLDGARGICFDESKDYVLVCAYDSDNLTIIDVTIPSSPSHVGHISDNTGGAIGVFVKGIYAYVACQTGDRLTAINIRNKSNPIFAGTISGSGNYLDGAQGVFVDDNYYAYVASSISDAFVVIEITPDPAYTPSNLAVVTDVEENELSWDEELSADTYNLYWMKYEFFADGFTSLELWDQYKDVGTETIEINSNKLRFSNSSGTGCHVVNKNEIPSGDFDIEIELVTYTPDDTSNGHKAILRTIDVYPYTNVDGAEIYYYISNAGSTYNIVSNIYINSVLNNVSTTIAGQPSKLRITRVGDTITTYYYISSWISVDNQDFSTRSLNIVVATLDTLQTSGNGGLTEFDNFNYYVDVKTLGTKITDVTSPYNHTSLDGGDNYIYVITGENPGGESDPSEIVNGVPLEPPASPPTGISIEEGEGQNTISFTANPGADYTHIYWANTPGVTKGTGTKIADVTSPHIHDDLNPSLEFYYILTSENEYGEGDASSEYEGSPYPEAPINVGVVAGIEQITITWDSVIGADSYNIYWSNTPGVTKGTGTKITGVISPHIHSSIIPGQPYYYVVTAEDEDGESSESSEVNEIPLLSIPSNVDASLSGSLEITVTWDSVSGATKYNIYWAKSSGVTKETGTKIADVTSPYIHSDLDDGDTYYYVVTAENVIEEGDESEEDSALAGDVSEPPEVVSAIATEIQEITISWSDVPGVEYYNIYYNVIPGVNKEVGVKIEDVTSPYIFDAPIPNINYYFVVTSVITVLGESDESEEVNALSIPPIPDAPTDILATAGPAKVTIDFTVAPYADMHNIYWSLTPGVTKLNGTKIADVSNPYDFIVPALYVPYYFVVTAENESGESDESVEVNATPVPVIPNVPENVEGEPTASGELTISWDTALYAETYNLYYSRLSNVDKISSTKIEGIADIETALGGLIAGRFYYFAVSAVNPEGESELSEEASARVINSLSGQQIFYIKAESETNGIIISWSELEYADSYNLYWSKNTPVDTATANKLENVSSPYRHYRLSTDDPYYVVTGENALGESDPSPEASADPNATDFQSINFLPENLHEYPLFQEFCNIVDYVVAKYHYENVDKLTGLYDAVHSDFDPNYVLSLLGSDYFLQFDLTDDQKKAMCLLLSNLYDMKGTKKGLDYVLRLMGLEAQVYEWYNINQGLYPEIPETVDTCSIVIDLGLGDHSLSDDTEQQFLNLASYLLWVCVKLHGIFWSKKFEDWFEGIEDQISTIEIDTYLFDKFCNYRYNYPETVIIGPPVESSVTFVGEAGLIIGALYFEGYPFLISADLGGDADPNGVCDAHFIGEPDIYIGGGDISQLTWVIEED